MKKDKQVTTMGALKRLSIRELQLLSKSEPNKLQQDIQSVLKLKVELRKLRDKYYRL